MTDIYEQYKLNFISADGSIKSIAILAHNLRKMNFFSVLIDEGEQQVDSLFVQMDVNNITILNNEYLKYDSFILLLNFLVHGSNSDQMNSPYALRAFKEAVNFCQAEGVLKVFINQEKSNISAAQFINAHYPAQLIYDAYKDQLNVESLIDEFLKYPCYSEILICGLGYTANQLQKNNICLDAVVQANCFSHKEVISAYGDSSALEFINAGISLKALAKHGHKGYGLKDTQYSAIELKDAGFNANQLKTAGFAAVELKAVGFDSWALKSAGFSAWNLKAAGFSLEEFILADFGVQELKVVNFTALELKAAGYSACKLKEIGFSDVALKAALFTAGQLKEAGLSAWALKMIGFTALELKSAHFTAGQLKGVFTAKELKSAGFDVEQLVEASFSVNILINIGCNVRQLTLAFLEYFQTLKLRSTTIADMVLFDMTSKCCRVENNAEQSQYYDELISFEALKLYGFETEDVTNDMIKAKAKITHQKRPYPSSLDHVLSAYIRNGYFDLHDKCTHYYYDAREMLAICFQKSGVSAKELKEAGFSVTHLKVAKFTLNEIITAGYTLKEIRQSHQYSDAKITNEANTISGQSHQPELTYQLREMRHANDCCSAM